MKIFITGGTGFIGSYVVKKLSDQGHKLTVLARNPDKIQELKRMPNIKLLHGDLSNKELINEGLKGNNACIHIALGWGDNPTDMLCNDTLASVQLFDLCSKNKVKQIIYTSSTAVNDWVYLSPESKSFGDKLKVYAHSKQNPVTYYGATKGASELFLSAIAFQNEIKANIIRPGYTFGNPVFDDSPVESDNRFRDIAAKALANEKINVIKYDGTQFIWAGDLAKIYASILESNNKNKTYLALGSTFITWEKIAKETILMSGSKSKIVIQDKGYAFNPNMFDVSGIKNDFGHSFDAWEKIREHIAFCLGKKIKAGVKVN